jgi:hypothetical protein
MLFTVKIESLAYTIYLIYINNLVKINQLFHTHYSITG